MKKYFSLLLILLVLFLVGCNASEDRFTITGKVTPADGLNKSKLYDGSKSDYRRYDDLPEDYYGGEAEGGIVPKESGVEPRDTDGEDPTQYFVASHQLTASVNWDNDKFDFWKSLQTSNQEGKGEFQSYYEKYAFKTYNRIKITLPKGVIATVKLLNENNELVYQSVTDSNGVAYLFSVEEQESYNISIDYYDSNNELVTFNDEVNGDKEYDLDTITNKKEQIELMFVIDATGSMADEMKYLMAEIKDVISEVKNKNENIEILLAIMVYRDTTDEYVTRYSDFTTDIDSQIWFLKDQSANGGGDFEEAVDTALLEAANKQWTNTASTKILVHVADAPAHDKDVAKWNAAVKTLASKGIRLISVASSGIDKKTEYFFRCQSIMTNGAYVYLTDDSGIGGGHIEASTEEKNTVEYLNSLLIRLINGFYTGDFGVAVDWRQETPKQ